VIILPDTDFFGAVVVADRARQALQSVLPEVSGGKALAANVGVSSIVPTPGGDASAFVKLVQHVLIAAEKKDGSRVAYADGKREIVVLDIGESLPSARRAPSPQQSDQTAANRYRSKSPARSRRTSRLPTATLSRTTKIRYTQNRSSKTIPTLSTGSPRPIDASAEPQFITG
jgi:hypothetical protein